MVAQWLETWTLGGRDDSIVFFYLKFTDDQISCRGFSSSGSTARLITLKGSEEQQAERGLICPAMKVEFPIHSSKDDCSNACLKFFFQSDSTCLCKLLQTILSHRKKESSVAEEGVQHS